MSASAKPVPASTTSPVARFSGTDLRINQFRGFQARERTDGSSSHRIVPTRHGSAQIRHPNS
jgi:hypothetical protein